jgi:MinD-like ATPase involved in chromosome partitioning or flagellar assembly
MIAVAGGKGGVGKTTIAANLALAIGRTGRRVAVVDADLGAANLHTMFGVVHPKATIADFLDHRVDDLAEVLVPVANTVRLAAGTSRPGAANINNAQKLRMLRSIARLDVDCVLVDVGAGTSFNVVDLVAAADLKLFVLTPQLPSVHNAFALLKACVHRAVRKLSSDETEQGLIDAALTNEGRARTIPQLLDVLRPMNHVLTERVTDILGRFGTRLISNQVSNATEGASLERISQLVHDQLQVRAPMVSTIPRTAALAGSLRPGAGSIVERHDPGYAAFDRIARSLVDADLDQLRGQTRTTSGTMPIWIQRELQQVAC